MAGHQRAVNDADRAAAAEARQATLDKLHAQLSDGILALNDPNAWQAWLKFSSQFHRYSALGHHLPGAGAVAFVGALGSAFVAVGADHSDRFGVDQLLQHDPDGLADNVDPLAVLDRRQQLGQGRLELGHR